MSDIELVSCFSKYKKNFLVSATIHKARNLSVLNADTFVVVSFNEEIKKTKIFQNSDCPFFNEYFVFEITSSLEDLLKKNVRICVVHLSSILKRNHTLGELNVNVSTIWKQNYHSFVKKWGVLEKVGNENSNISAGYLQVDLSIISTIEPPSPAILQIEQDDIIENNLLLPDSEDKETENVKYAVNIFEGTFIVKRDYIIQVSFGSYHSRTIQAKNTKSFKWNEQMIFYGKFQSVNQMINIELLVQDSLQWKVKCAYQLNFNEMCWKVHGIYNKPAFGPTIIQFYEGFHNHLYYGKLLMSIETELIDQSLINPMIPKQDIKIPLNEFDYWTEEVFCVHMIMINTDFLNTTQNNVKMYLSCENIYSNAIDLELEDYYGKSKLKFVKLNSNVRPLMSLLIKLPDNRLKHQIGNLFKEIVDKMEQNINNYKLFEVHFHDNIEYHRKSLNLIFLELKEKLEALKMKMYYKIFKQLTAWDNNYLRFVDAEVKTILITVLKCMEELNNEICETENLRNQFQNYLIIRERIIEFINHVHDASPDVFLNITKDNKLLGFHKFTMNNYFFSQAKDACGLYCGKVQSVLIKPVTCQHSCFDCGCVFGQFEVLIWIGSEKEKNEWLPEKTIEISMNKISFSVEKYFKCNVYVHQAKIRPGNDKSGLCDPKLVVFYDSKCEKTKVIAQSLSAVWNEVLVIENIKLFDIGQNRTIGCNFPVLMIALFDEDKRKSNLIGISSLCCPIKFMIENDKQLESKKSNKESINKIFYDFCNKFPPQLRWIRFHKDGLLTAEVLLSAEFVEVSIPTQTIREIHTNETIPPEISPVMKQFKLEAVFVGIRDALDLTRFSSGRYKIELCIGELVLSSGFSGKSFKKNLNFLDPYAAGYLFLPEQFEYWPPIIIKHLDCSHLKHPVIIGAAMVRRPHAFLIKEKSKEFRNFLIEPSTTFKENDDQEVIDMNETEPLLNNSSTVAKSSNILRSLKFPKIMSFRRKLVFEHESNPLESEYTWWTKFYNSNGVASQSFSNQTQNNDDIHKLKIFNSELEKQKEFEFLVDWAHPFDLINGKQHLERNQIREKYATLKCSIKIAKCTGKEFFKSEDNVSGNYQFSKVSNLICEFPVVVRVYIVQGLNLRSRDIFGYSDAFLKIEFGGTVISDQAHFIQNQCNPIFGKRFQMTGCIPKDRLLKISIYDRDSSLKSDYIGCTVIDLEDRMRTKYMAACGLPEEYNSSGYNAWRNNLQPSVLLENVCHDLGLMSPLYTSDRVCIADVNFMDNSTISKDTNIKEKLALSALNNLHKIPSVGYSFVPEHVETRSIYRNDRPGVEQGKLQMWVDIFDPKKMIPSPIDITPIPARPYELRIVIWNSKDVILDEKNIFGVSMSDIYVKGWLADNKKAQFTDVHYRSLNGEGNFNWRMIFSFKYSLGENMMQIIRKKSPFEKFDTELKMPALLTLQIWDNDSFSPDDFLGTLTINLSHFPKPSVNADKCDLKQVHEYENLFVGGIVKGWFPMYGKNDVDEMKQTGKLELELEVLLLDKAQSNPAGLGRSPPNELPTPNRPKSSFKWYSNLFKSFRHILWPQIRKYVIICIILLIIASIAFILFITLR